MKTIVAAFLLAAALPLSAAVPVTPLVGPRVYWTDNNGKPCSGCKFWTYAAGTTTPLATYSDPAGNVANTNPVIMDSAGRANIFISNNTYKFVLETAIGTPHGTVLWTQDNYSGSAFVNVAFPVTVDKGGTGDTTLPANNLLIGNGTSPVTGLSPLGAPTKYVRSKPNVATPVFELANLPVVSVADYNFPAQQPGGSLTGSTPATVSLQPCPLGMALSGGYKMYVSGGAGTAEAVTITGGTCSPGGNVGTVQFTPANSHSGAWTIGSATGGFQEVYNAQNGCGSAVIPNGPAVLFHAAVAMSAVCNFSWNGQSLISTTAAGPSIVQRASDYLAGDLFTVSNGTGAEFRNFQLWNEPPSGTSTGWAIDAHGTSGVGVGYLHITDVQAYGGAGGLLIDGCATSNIQGFTWNKFSGGASGVGIQFQSSGGISNQSSIISHSLFSTITGFAAKGILISGKTDGVIITSSLFGGPFSDEDLAIALASPSDLALNITINDNFFDAPDGWGVLIGADAGGLIQGINIVGNHFGGQWTLAGQPNQQCGIDLGHTFSTNAFDVTIASNRIYTWAGPGICIGDGTATHPNWLVSGNNIIANGQKSSLIHAGIVVKGGALDVSLTGNISSNGVSGWADSQDYGIQLQGSLTNAIIAGNSLLHNAISPITYDPTLMSNVVINSNSGIDDSPIGTIASATSIALPNANPVYFLSGTATVTTITGALHPGDRRTFIQSGTVVIGGGGNIPGGHAFSANNSVTLTWSGTNWY